MEGMSLNDEGTYCIPDAYALDPCSGVTLDADVLACLS